MTMLKVIEVLSHSEKSWEDAAQKAITEAAKRLHNVRSLYVENMEAAVQDGKITEYRINGKISFVMDDTKATKNSKSNKIK